MINRKFSGPLGRATKFSHPRATMSVIVVMFIAANKFTAFCAIRLLDFRPTDHRRQQNIGGVRVLVASTTKGVDVRLGGAGGRDACGSVWSYSYSEQKSRRKLMREFAVIFIAARPKPSMATQTQPPAAIPYPLLILIGFG